MKATIIRIWFLAAGWLLAAGTAGAATITWSAGIDNGLSLADGTNLAVGSLVRLGYFRDPVTSLALTDAQIQALAGDLTALNADFVEAGSTTIGAGLSGSTPAHFSATNSVDTGSAGLNLEGRQMVLWVLDAPTPGAATAQGIFYWDITNPSSNPDATPLPPGLRWTFPYQDPPGATSIDLTDLTMGSGVLAAGAHVVVGTFGAGTSAATGAPDFALASVVPEPGSGVLTVGAGAMVAMRRRRGPRAG